MTAVNRRSTIYAQPLGNAYTSTYRINRSFAVCFDRKLSCARSKGLRIAVYRTVFQVCIGIILQEIVRHGHPKSGPACSAHLSGNIDFRCARTGLYRNPLCRQIRDLFHTGGHIIIRQLQTQRPGCAKATLGGSCPRSRIHIQRIGICAVFQRILGSIIHDESTAFNPGRKIVVHITDGHGSQPRTIARACQTKGCCNDFIAISSLFRQIFINRLRIIVVLLLQLFCVAVPFNINIRLFQGCVVLFVFTGGIHGLVLRKILYSTCMDRRIFNHGLRFIFQFIVSCYTLETIALA